MFSSGKFAIISEVMHFFRTAYLPNGFHIEDFIPLICGKAKWNPNSPPAMCISRSLCSAYAQDSFPEPRLPKKGSELAGKKHKIDFMPVSP